MKKGQLQTLTDDYGAMNWQYVAVQALGSVIVGARMGEDAGLNYFGEAIGQGINERVYRERALDSATKGLEVDPRFEGLSPERRRQVAITLNDRGAKAAMEQLERFDIAKRAEKPFSVDYSFASPGIRLGNAGEASAPDTAELGAGPAAADLGDPRAAFRKSEIEYANRTSAVVQKGDTVEAMARRQAATNGEPDNWRAYQALALVNNKLSVDEKGNPIIHKGQTLHFGDTSLYGEQGMDKLNQAGGKFTAWNTTKTAEHHQHLAAQERQRIDNLYAAAGPRGGTGAAYGDADMAPPAGSAYLPSVNDTGVDYSQLATQMDGGTTGQGAFRDPEGGVKFAKMLVGAGELALSGVYNQGVRIFGGVLSVPAMADGVDTAVRLQNRVDEVLAYKPRSEGAAMWGEALAPLGRDIAQASNQLRAFSERHLGDGATTAGAVVLQAGAEILGTVTGLKGAQSVLGAAGRYGDYSIELNTGSPGTLYSNPLPVRLVAPEAKAGSVTAQTPEVGGVAGMQVRATYHIGSSDGGPGEWAMSSKYPTKAADAEFQQAATGAPKGVEYRVATDKMRRGEKWFDGFDPATNRLVDAKNYTDWPKTDIPFSMRRVGDDLAKSDEIARDFGRQIEIRVASQEKANLLRTIVRQRGLENTIVRFFDGKN